MQITNEIIQAYFDCNYKANLIAKEAIISTEYKTEVSNHYKNRFKRYKSNLFEFLNHNSVSWHNGNAEHAIRLLAFHTNKNMTMFRKSQIDNYLKIFSIFQTCDFNNVSFLKFMLSKEISVYEYIKKAAN